MNEMQNAELIPLPQLLSDIIDNRGKTCPTVEKGFPLIATNCIKNDKLYPVFENIRYVSDEVLENWFRQKLEPNDILFVNKGTPGKVCLVPDPVTFCAAQDMVAFRADETKIYYKYLFFILKSEYIQKKISNYHVGVAIPHFKKQDLKELLIPVPSMKLQIKIGDLYCTLFEKIHNNELINSEIESLIKDIFDYWFLQFDFPNEDNKPYKSSGGEMSYNDTLDMFIPKDWKVLELGDNLLKTIESGKRPSGGIDDIEEGVPSIGAENILGLGKFDFSKNKLVPLDFFNNMKKGVIKDKDVLLYKDGAKVGRKSFFMNGFPFSKCCVNEHVAILRTNENLSPYYLYFWLDHEWMEKKIIKLSANSAQPGINQKDIKSLQIILPPKNILDKFDKLINPYIEIIFNNSLENKELLDFKEFLHPLLLSGQVGFKE